MVRPGIINTSILWSVPVPVPAVQRRRPHKLGRMGVQLRGPRASHQGQPSIPASPLFIIRDEASQFERATHRQRNKTVIVTSRIPRRTRGNGTTRDTEGRLTGTE